MATQGPKIVQRVEISNQPSNINAISWSSDNRLAVLTNGCVAIVSIKGVQKVEKKRGPRFKITRNIINAETNSQDFDVDMDFHDPSSSLPMLSDSPCYSTFSLDPALCPYILRNTCSSDITFAKWSPPGCDEIGRSVLAVLFRTNKLGLFVAEKLANKWKEIFDLTKNHYKQLKTEEYFTANVSLKGKAPPDIRTIIGEEDAWNKFQEWKRRKYLLAFTCIEWCPFWMTCVNQANRTSSKFAFLATAVKSGQLFIWQGKLPLAGADCSMTRVLAAQTGMHYPCSLAWSTVTAEGATYLACGSTEGLIKVFAIKISSNTRGLPVISFYKAYTFVDSADDRSVDCMAWHCKEDKLFLVCSKGPHISVFCTHLMNGGSLSKPIEHVISGVHLLNVTALTISSSGTLYTTSAEGTVQQYKLGCNGQNTAIDCEMTSGCGYAGVTVSPNGVFLALLENKRKMFTKRRTAAGGCQIAILSLITEKENNQQLLSCTSKPANIPRLWDRFFFQEMSTQELLASFSLPEMLKGLSRSHLQFLRNVINKGQSAAKSKDKTPRDGHLAKETEVPVNNEQHMDQIVASSEVDMVSSSEKVNPSPKTVNMIEKIDDEIAALEMQNVLTAFSRPQEGNKMNPRNCLEEPLIRCICRWLAQKSPADSVSELLRKTWGICNQNITPEKWNDETQMTVDLSPKSQESFNSASRYKELKETRTSPNIFQEILARTDVFENCMCGQPIILQEHRFGRCSAGHVWPRCCVTFTLLEGTNCRICENCGAHAQIESPSGSSRSDWVKDLLKENSSCTYCGGWFEYGY